MRSFPKTAGLRAVTMIQATMLMLALLAQGAVAGPAPAGTLIRNVAQTTYFNPALGIVETVLSNPVEAMVLPVPAIEVSGYSDLVLSRGAIDQYHFEVLNTGNVAVTAQMGVEDRLGAGLTGAGRLVADLNGNGLIDASDLVVDATSPISLMAGERIALIYDFRVSLTAQPGDRSASVLVVTATPQSGAAPQTPLQGEARGVTTIVNGGLEIEKSQTVRDGEGGDVLEYTLRVRNNSEEAVTGLDVVEGAALRIDGAGRTGVLVRDDIPRNSVFQAISDAGGMVALFHRAGDSKHDYLTAQPQRAEDIDAVAFFLDGDFAVGRSTDPTFSVTVPAVLGNVDILNTASAFLEGGETPLAVASNTTIFTRDDSGSGAIRFEDPATGADQVVGAPGSDTRLRVTSGNCNVSDAVDQVTVTIRSGKTGDVERVVATETSPNSGIFLTPGVPMARMNAAVSGDTVVATAQGDVLFATAQCDDALLEDDLLINPGNFLFNSVTNAPISGVTIALVDAASGAQLARSVTDPRGFFAFGDMPTGRYRYEVVNAPTWDFPSIKLDFLGFGRSVADAAYGNAFTHAGGLIYISDIPVDPHYGASLSLDKVADRETVSNGEYVNYTLDFSNNMQQALIGAEILDRPAFGVTLVPGSVMLNGEPLGDPAHDQSGDLVFDLGTLGPLSPHELTYVMRFTAAAREGRNENTAVLSGRQAGTGTPRQSPIARAMVRLDNSGGVFARQGTVIGSVFMDCDGNGTRGDSPEPGIPGVRIVTQEGLSVVTDIDGKYSLYGLRPVTHAFLVQAETLPAGTDVRVTRTNDLMRGGSRLIPLRKGELRAEHFAVATCTPKTLAEVAKRVAHFEANQQPNALTAADLPITGQRTPVRSSRSEQGIATTTQLTPRMLVDDAEAAETVATKAQALARRQTLDAVIKTLDSKPGFLDLADGQTVMRATQNIRVKGKADLTLALMLNGRALGQDRVGERSNWEKHNVQAMEFVAVKLSAGENRLTLVGKDGFGIERVRTEITLFAPGKPAQFEIILPDAAPASPVSIVPVVVRVLDARGLPVPASGTITLNARNALWDVTDIRPGTPGVQAFLDNGEATFGLIPPQVSGPDRITVSGPFGSVEATINFTPDLDERILIGVIEGAVSLGKNEGTLLDKGRFSSFEDTATGVRGEIYLKGAIRGDALLTLRYSSDRDTEDRLFRDIRGDEYYPVYGDNSERGQDAQSSGNLFVKVEKGRSYVLYGDIAIEPEASAFKLDGLRRVATGAKAHWENDKVSVTVFGARTAQEQQVQEVRGRGVSGPYDLDLGGYVQGSERVEIVVRDDRGGDILTSTSMRRGTDYILDFFRNTITFDAPVRQFDLDGNPVSIRVTYEVENEGAERYWLYGGEVNYALGELTTVGARAVHADAPVGNPARERLQSGYIRHEDTAGGIWEAEVARSEDFRGETDGAARLSYTLQTERQRLNFEAIHTGESFVARGGLARPGTSQVRLDYGYLIDRKSDIAIAAELVRDRINDFDRFSVEALYSRQFNRHVRGEIGLEYGRDVSQNVTEHGTALILGAHWTPRNRPGTVIQSRLRHPLSGSDGPTELTLGMYREAKPGWRVYNEVELRFGDDTAVSHSALGFTFEMNDWLSGRTELTKGVGESDTTYTQAFDARFNLNSMTTLSFGIEHSRLMDANEAKLTSVALGMKWGSDQAGWVGDADFDTTFERAGNTYYASLGLAGSITPDLTVLGRSRIAVDDRDGTSSSRMRTRAGIAYRPINDPRLEVLAWYEHRLEKKNSQIQSHLWSVDATYEAGPDLRVNGKYAGQHQKIGLPGGASTGSTTQLLQAGLNHEFGNDRFQIGANAAYLWDDEGNSTTGLGTEFGIVPAKGTLLAVGYNKAKGNVARSSSLYQEGFYLRFNLLLDNSLWDRLDGFLGN
ncbi:hypothetical protein [uncultured Roseovarius sp.]|uniref:hypothetical protein n=1 Tax=uncultured Roseovarius sp. TaxID=293344 RepID=UPI00262354C0|nr:hypothetical protein [uncultured Roseovarius sp.]